jgi:hypothetical protein
MQRVHHTAGLYFASRSGVAHAEMDCQNVDERVIANLRWRVASDTQCRALGMGWCVACCS